MFLQDVLFDLFSICIRKRKNNQRQAEVFALGKKRGKIKQMRNSCGLLISCVVLLHFVFGCVTGSLVMGPDADNSQPDFS